MIGSMIYAVLTAEKNEVESRNRIVTQTITGIHCLRPATSAPTTATSLFTAYETSQTKPKDKQWAGTDNISGRLYAHGFNHQLLSCGQRQSIRKIFPSTAL